MELDFIVVCSENFVCSEKCGCQCFLQVYFDVVEEIDCIIDKHVSSHVYIRSFIFQVEL